MRIACIYPQPIGANFNIISGEPIGLLYIAGVASSRGIEVEIFIPNASESDEAFTERILAYSPDILAFSVMTFQAYRSAKLLHEIKQKKQGVVSIAGGPHPTLEPEFFLYRGFDVCVIGEGEIAFGDFLDRISKNESITGIPGTAYKDTGGIVNVSQPHRANLDKLPLPVRIPSLIDGKTYNGIAYPAPHIRGWAGISSTRGCPYSCAFCNAPQMWGRKVTRRSPKKVVEEMIHLHEAYQVELFEFVDLVFTSSNQYVMSLCEEIMRSGLDVHWFCMSSVDSLDNLEMLYAMKDAGCTLISIGVESTDRKTRARINKRITDEAVIAILDMLYFIGISTNIFYIIGFPWQDRRDILAETDDLCQLNAHKIQVFIATPFPMTPLWFQIKNDLLPNLYDLYDTEHLVYRHPSLSPEEVKDLQEMVVRNFYLNAYYKMRVKSFLDKFPQYGETFLSYWKTLPFFPELERYLEIEGERSPNAGSSCASRKEKLCARQ